VEDNEATRRVLEALFDIKARLLELIERYRELNARKRAAGS